MRWHLLHHLSFLIKRADIFTVEFQHRVNHVRANGTVLGFPAKDLGIEFLRAGAIGRG